MRVSRARRLGEPAALRADTFTGEVWVAPVIGPDATLGVNDVHFAPRARTHWHRHEVAQVLIVTHGEGLIELRGGPLRRLLPGDVVHILAGEEHWHGATQSTYLLHTAISMGKIEWLSAVSDKEYQRALCEAADG